MRAFTIVGAWFTMTIKNKAKPPHNLNDSWQVFLDAVDKSEYQQFKKMQFCIEYGTKWRNTDALWQKFSIYLLDLIY